MNIELLQEEFAQALAKLIGAAPTFGYTVTLGEAYRTPEQAQWDCKHNTGVADSLHTLRLAQDLNFRKDRVLITDGSQLTDIGNWWKSLGPMYRWGGDIVHPRPDGNHFSLSPDGVRA